MLRRHQLGLKGTPGDCDKINKCVSNVEITYLSIPADAESHARRFGAQRDGSGCWYVVGTVPNELRNYLPRKQNASFYEFTPTCPRCGATMRKTIGKAGDAFWGCVTHFATGCKGTIDYRDYLDDAAPSLSIGDFLPRPERSFLLPDLSLGKYGDAPASMASDRLQDAWSDIIRHALDILGGELQVRRWMTQPKVRFKNRAPLEMMVTESGCAAVKALLDEVWR
jgi:hypothetical protein